MEFRASQGHSAPGAHREPSAIPHSLKAPKRRSGIEKPLVSVKERDEH